MCVCVSIVQESPTIRQRITYIIYFYAILRLYYYYFVVLRLDPPYDGYMYNPLI